MTQRIYYRNGRRVTPNISIKFRGHEVQNPALRVLLGFLLAIISVVMMLFWLALVGLLVALSPALTVLHVALRAFGRNGFVYRSPGKLSIKVSIDGFRKA